MKISSYRNVCIEMLVFIIISDLFMLLLPIINWAMMGMAFGLALGYCLAMLGLYLDVLVKSGVL